MIDGMIGKPYEENGRGPDGYDCWGVCMTVCEQFNIWLPEQELLTDSLFIEIYDPEPGDIALIATESGRHVGVMEDKFSLLTVHSTGRRGVHRMRIDHPWIAGRIQGYYRYAG